MIIFCKSKVTERGPDRDRDLVAAALFCNPMAMTVGAGPD